MTSSGYAANASTTASNYTVASQRRRRTNCRSERPLQSGALVLSPKPDHRQAMDRSTFNLTALESAPCAHSANVPTQPMPIESSGGFSDDIVVVGAGYRLGVGVNDTLSFWEALCTAGTIGTGIFTANFSAQFRPSFLSEYVLGAQGHHDPGAQCQKATSPSSPSGDFPSEVLHSHDPLSNHVDDCQGAKASRPDTDPFKFFGLSQDLEPGTGLQLQKFEQLAIAAAEALITAVLLNATTQLWSRSIACVTKTQQGIGLSRQDDEVHFLDLVHKIRHADQPWTSNQSMSDTSNQARQTLALVDYDYELPLHFNLRNNFQDLSQGFETGSNHVHLTYHRLLPHSPVYRHRVGTAGDEAT